MRTLTLLLTMDTKMRTKDNNNIQYLRYRRRKNEIQELLSNAPTGISASPLTNQEENWIATIDGPQNTPYQGGRFYVKIQITKEYPFKPPCISFKTKIYHVEINDHEKLQFPHWSPCMKIYDLLVKIQKLLLQPAPSYVSNTEFFIYIIKLCINTECYQQIAAEWTKKYAMGHVNESNRQNKDRNTEYRIQICECSDDLLDMKEKIRDSKYKMNKLIELLQSQIQELTDLTEIAYERYIFEKKSLLNKEKVRTHFEEKNQILYNTLTKHFETIMQIFETNE